MNELEQEITEIEMEIEDFPEMFRAMAEAGGITKAEMVERGWPRPFINLIENMRDAIRAYDAEKGMCDE